MIRNSSQGSQLDWQDTPYLRPPSVLLVNHVEIQDQHHNCSSVLVVAPASPTVTSLTAGFVQSSPRVAPSFTAARFEGQLKFCGLKTL